MENPEQSAALYQEMAQIMEGMSPDERYYNLMDSAFRDMEAYQRGEYSLFTPLPEAVLEAERAKRRAEKEAKKAEQQKERQSRQRAKEAVQSEQETEPELNTPEARETGEIDLMAAARRLLRKVAPPVTERESGQFSLFGVSDEPEEESTPVSENPPIFSDSAPEPVEPKPEEAQTEPVRKDSQEAETQTNGDSVSTVERDDYLLIPNRGVYTLYEEKARRAAKLLNLPLREQEQTDDESLDVCDIPADRLEEAIEKLRVGFNVSLMSIDETGELKLVRRYPATGELPEKSAEPETVKESAQLEKQYDLGYGYPMSTT